MPSRLGFARAAPASAPSSHQMTLRSSHRTLSPFLLLPLEIRYQIYSLLFDFANLATVPDPAGLHLRQSPGVLRVCRQISDEALQILYTKPLRPNQERLQHREGLEKYVMNSSLVRSLRFIDLSCNPYCPALSYSARISRISGFLSTVEQIVVLWTKELGKLSQKAVDDKSRPSPRLLRVELMLNEDEDHGFRVPIRRRETVDAHRQCRRVVDLCTKLIDMDPERIRVELGNSLREYYVLYEPLQQRAMQRRNNGR